MPPELLISWLVSAGTPYVLQWLKAQPWAPFIQPYAPTLNRITAVAASLVTALGVTWTYDAATGQLVVSGLVLADVVRLGLSIVGNFVVQEVVYRTRLHTPKA